MLARFADGSIRNNLNEGDIHVWSDDRVAYQCVEDVLRGLGFEVVLSRDYHHFNQLCSPEVYKKYEKLCADVRLMVFRKC